MWEYVKPGENLFVLWQRRAWSAAAGQTQTKEFKTSEEVRKAYDKLVREKVKKGYRPVTGAAFPVSRSRQQNA
jgi:predicted DNA-binding WGR domain protein